jgi:hypothetical protein
VTGVEPAIRGGLALSSEYAIELVGAQLAADGEERAAILSCVLKDPLMAIPFYVVGPIFFYVGLLVLRLGLKSPPPASSPDRAFSALGMLVADVS